MQEPHNAPDAQAPAEDMVKPAKWPWQTPVVTEISKFEILSLGPTPGPEESDIYFLKS